MNKLKAAILDSGRPQYKLAHDVEETETTVSRIATGRRAATPDQQRKLARALGERVEKLFDEEGYAR